MVRLFIRLFTPVRKYTGESVIINYSVESIGVFRRLYPGNEKKD